MAAITERAGSRARVGVDVGGTFTDLVALVDGELRIAKVSSTPGDQSNGVMAALDGIAIDADRVEAFAHGTTVATNALLERSGARTALLTTDGFRDVLEIARQNASVALRPDPASARRRSSRASFGSRCASASAPTARSRRSTRTTWPRRSRRCGPPTSTRSPSAFSSRSSTPRTSARAGEALRAALPRRAVSLSSEVLPEFREYERFSTTTAGRVSRPSARLAISSAFGERLDAAGLPPPLVMQSSGGVVDLDRPRSARPTCVLSGPAAGVSGLLYAAESQRLPRSPHLRHGRHEHRRRARGRRRGAGDHRLRRRRHPDQAPMVDVHTVSAGGGSIAWADGGGALRVGPRSAGAEPGPASYGLGGEEATVTDADVYLGYLADGARLGGEIVLDRARAQAALAAPRRELGLSSARDGDRGRGRRRGADGPGAARDQRRAGLRPARASPSSPSAARAACTPAGSPRRSGPPPSSCRAPPGC